ncbi:UNVERIFIED_CONTAM: hypothetical protein FKN15_078556 [Acipenser sinensis]
MLLMNLSEEEAFWALVALLEGPNYLAGLFDHSLDKLDLCDSEALLLLTAEKCSILQECLKGIRRQLVDLGVSEFGIGSAIATLSEAENEMESKKNTSQSAASSSEFSDVVLFRQIALDLQRSFPTHRSLMGDASEAIEGQAKLFRVLIAYAIYNPWIGYSQEFSTMPKYFSSYLNTECLDFVNIFEALLLLTAEKCSILQVGERLAACISDIARDQGRGGQSLKVLEIFVLSGPFACMCLERMCIVVVFTTGLCILQQLESRLLEMSDVSLLLPTLLRVPVDVSRHSVLVPALWRSEVHKWEIDCMQSLVLEEEREEPAPGEN